MTGHPAFLSNGEDPLTPLHQAALRYAERYRLLVIPLDPREKRPAFKSGPNHSNLATLNLEKIGGWWQHQDYNIGLPCTANRLAVVDVDGSEGAEHLAQLEAEHGPLPTTWMQSSNREDRPSEQYVYRWPANELVPTRSISPQLEIRAHGAQIVVAPSVHPTGSTYRWLIPPLDMPDGPADLPAWVLGLLTRSTEASDRSMTVPPAITGTTIAEKRFQGLVEAVATATEGTRNAMLNHAVYTAARIPGITDNQITSRLTAAAQTVGLDDKEITSTIQSGLTAGHRDGPDPEHYEPNPVIITRQVAPSELATPPQDLDNFLETPDPEYDWVIDQLLERGDRVILTGTEGSGKSTLLRQIAVTTGAGIHPFTGEPSRRNRVLLIDLENSVKQSRRQLRPLRETAGERLEPGYVYPIIRPEGLNLLTTEDQQWLVDVIQEITPDILIIGPVYKLIGGDPTEEQPAKAAATLLDDLRTRHDFAIVMEAHSPHGESGRKRPKRPYGASLWLRWPEFGLHINEIGSLSHWRGQRDERSWPALLKRDGIWPWMTTFTPQEILWEQIVTACQTQAFIFRPSLRQLEAVIAGTSRSSIDRAIKGHEKEWEAMYPEETE